MKEAPVACALSAEDRQERFREFAELGAAALLEAERTADGARLRLRDGPGVRSALSRLIEAERSCCSFLEFTVDAGGSDLVVEVSGPPAAGPLIDRLFLPVAAARPSAVHRRSST
jgi:hypothetical protein